uniref:Pol Polyprotein n=1 Tax=Peronospora matthiolae TaxID=2874970 RepID=A0AAV1TMT9_9STRA
MGNAYTIELPRKMRTHPTFYVGRLRQCYQYEPVSRCEEHLHGREPRSPSSGPVSTIQSGRLAKRPVHAAQRCLNEQQPAHHEENESNVRSQAARTQKRHDRSNDRALRNCIYLSQDPQAHNAEYVHDPGHLATVPLHGSALEQQADPTLEPDQVFPPPHLLVDSSGGQRFLVERTLSHRDVNGVRTSYLYDGTHPLRLKKGRRKRPPRTRVQGLQSVDSFGHLGRNARPPVGIIREPVQLVSRPNGVTFLKPDASCIKFGEPSLTANALDVVDEGIPSLHQGFAVSYKAAIVPPMLEERIGEEFSLSTDSFRAGIRRANLPRVKQRDSVPSVFVPANRSNSLDDSILGDAT